MRARDIQPGQQYTRRYSLPTEADRAGGHGLASPLRRLFKLAR